MKSLWNAKKVIFALILLLISCDVSLLFAAQTGVDTGNNLQQQQLQQVQQLRQQLQQQIAAAQAQKQAQQTQQAQQAPASQSLQPTFAPAPTNPPTQLAAANSADAANQLQALPAAPPVIGGQTPQAVALTPTAGPAVAPTTVGGGLTEDDINNQAFDEVTKNTLPMSPAQIQRLRQLFNQTQFAAAASPDVPPKPIITSQFVNLAPGTTPPVVRLQQGMVSVLGFIDGTGAPWPIESYDIGNPAAFNIQWNRSDNTLIIQPLTLYTYGNLAVKLQGLSTPVILMLIPGQKVFDGRLDLHVPLYGPNAFPVSGGSGLPNSANPELLGVLDGVPPAGSVTLLVSGGACEAWVVGNRLFVRTRLTILSPAWVATMSSADGMKAYEIPKPSEQTPMLLASQDGKIVQLKIEGL